MNDPYAILGISPQASDEQVKKAYKNLAKKASSLSGEELQRRMCELDGAYDAIMNQRISHTASGGSVYTQAEETPGTDYRNFAPADYQDVSALIAQERYEDADTILNGVPPFSRNAEWHYLKGQVLYNKGWLENAAGEFETAYRMDSSNREYRSAYESIHAKKGGGYHYREKQNSGFGCDVCDICSGLICADCCCEGMGGDLIPCC